MTETEKFLRQGAIVEVHLNYGLPFTACLIETSPTGVLVYLGAIVGTKSLTAYIPLTAIRLLRSTSLMQLPKGKTSLTVSKYQEAATAIRHPPWRLP